MIYVLLRKICTLKSCIVLVFGIEGIGSENEVYCYFASVKCMHFVCVYLMCAGYHGCIFSRHALCDDIGIVLSFAILVSVATVVCTRWLVRSSTNSLQEVVLS